MPAWDELFLRQRTKGTECSLVAGVEVQLVEPMYTREESLHVAAMKTKLLT